MEILVKVHVKKLWVISRQENQMFWLQQMLLLVELILMELRM